MNPPLVDEEKSTLFQHGLDLFSILLIVPGNRRFWPASETSVSKSQSSLLRNDRQGEKWSCHTERSEVSLTIFVQPFSRDSSFAMLTQNDNNQLNILSSRGLSATNDEAILPLIECFTVSWRFTMTGWIIQDWWLCLLVQTGNFFIFTTV